MLLQSNVSWKITFVKGTTFSGNSFFSNLVGTSRTKHWTKIFSLVERVELASS